MPRAPRRPPEKNVGRRFSFAPVSRILNTLAFTETGHGERMGVVCRLAARERRDKHRGGKLREQRWHNLHAAVRLLKAICHYADKDVAAALPDTIETCVWDNEARQVPCF